MHQELLDAPGSIIPPLQLTPAPQTILHRLKKYVTLSTFPIHATVLLLLWDSKTLQKMILMINKAKEKVHKRIIIT